MKWNALLCALSVVFLTFPAMSQEPCRTVAMFTEHMVPEVERLPDLTGAMAQAVIAAFNAVPPPTGYPGDTVLIFRHPASPDRLLAIVSQGCVVIAHPISPRLLADWMGGGGEL